MKKIYGIIGFPVKHSLSPAMHNAAFRALDINAEYMLFEVKPEELKSFFNNLDKSNILGLNVTIPHKEKVFGFVSLEPDNSYLRQIGAINTIVNKKGQWLGYNTDISGFTKHLKENFDPANKKVAIIGAGGAARAVSFALVKSGAKEISIFDIDQKKSENISKMLRGLFPDFLISIAKNIEDLQIKNKNLLINATPLGMKPKDPCPVEEKQLHKDLFVYDLIYNPAETKLLKLAKKAGAQTSDGLGMLLYQGMLSFEIWTGGPAPKETMQKALINALRSL
ncbi:MAG: shikimate dehydrogenase [Candidatus Omnitrophica bacterium]|nr:shikimate dehydrogenase [Candidatus Omnitrophota bacterium]